MRQESEHELGLYRGTSEDSFASIEQIRQERIDRMFPDKKVRNLDYERVTNYLQEGREIAKEFEIGQREATFVPDPEMPDLPIVILLASDIHYGSTGVRYDILKYFLDAVDELPNFYLATNGDEVDAFNAVFHPTGMTENPLPPQIQSRAIAEKLRTLDEKGKIAVLSQGNHNRSGFAGGQDWYDSFLSGFRCPVFTSGGLLHVDYRGAVYNGLMNHTYWGKSKLNPCNSVKRMIEYEGGGVGDIDFGWVGHVHQSDVEHFERGGKDVLAFVSGTLKQDDKWAAQNGIGGRGQLAGTSIMLFPEEKQMVGFKQFKSAVDIMTKMMSNR